MITICYKRIAFVSNHSVHCDLCPPVTKRQFPLHTHRPLDIFLFLRLRFGIPWISVCFDTFMCYVGGFIRFTRSDSPTTHTLYRLGEQSCFKSIRSAPWFYISAEALHSPPSLPLSFFIWHLAGARTRYVQHVWVIGSHQRVSLGADALRFLAAKLWTFAFLHFAATVYFIYVINLSNVAGPFILTLQPTHIRVTWAALWHLYSLISCSARLSRCSFWWPVLSFKKKEPKHLI